MSDEVAAPPRSFELDRFQMDAIEHIDAGRSVVVSAPTGSGKTYVAEYALASAHAKGLRGMYTTPIKALSNQKFRDLSGWLGSPRVGLLTGDNSINGNAEAVVMTTEVLRNMLYTEPARLDRVGVVVMDEVHYLQDNYRGPVWEEVIIHLPSHIGLVALSATVSNAEELADWISSVHAECEAVTETTRPVVLENSYFVAEKNRARYHIIPTLRKGRPNPDGKRFDIRRDGRGGHPRSGSGNRRWRTPRRVEVIEELDRRGLLPAITFIFSRAGCEDAVRALRADGVRLTSDSDVEKILEIAERRTGFLDQVDRNALGHSEWLAGLTAGIAAHHAGIVPLFKETVEELFTAGLLRAVFATETLALGINMPARTVVIEKLSKFTGERHETLRAADYTQLTGRAGRRGIDDRGYAFVLWTPFTEFAEVASLARSKSFELRSAFRPTYNMTCHLVSRYTRAEAEELVARSFGQFQTDRAVGALEERRAALLRRRGHDEPAPAASERDRAAVEAALAGFKPGDVVDIGQPAAILTTTWRRKALKITVLDRDGVVRDLDPEAVDEVPVLIHRLKLPQPFDPHNQLQQHELAEALARIRRRGQGSGKAAGKKSVRADRDTDDGPWRGGRVADQRRELARLETRIEQRRGRLADRFKAVVGLLSELGYIERWTLTERGTILLGTFHELDLVLVESLLAGHLDGHDPASLAGVVSTFVYEPRGPEDEAEEWFANDASRDAVTGIIATVDEIQRLESAYGLPASRDVDPGLFAAAHGWTAGADLGDILDDDDLSGGDFVRLMKQVLDLTSQLAMVAPVAATRSTAAAASDRIQRGIIDSPADLLPTIDRRT